jgi:hypothetical protein
MSQKKKRGSSRLDRNRARATIEEICKEHLRDSGDVLIFEALPAVLDSVVSVIEEPPLSTKYDIMQIDETIFQVSLKEIDIM